MSMTIDPRGFILFGCNVLLLFLTQLVNSGLAVTTLHLVLIGPMLILPVLRLSLPSAFLCLLLTGLWIDAASPVPYGFFTAHFLVIGTFLRALRRRFSVERDRPPVLTAHAINFIIVLSLGVSMTGDFPQIGGYWIQVLVTGLLSHVALLGVAPWFFNFQHMCCSGPRLGTEPDDSTLHRP